MITAIFNFFLRLLGIGNQAALDHASEALPDKVTLKQFDTTVLDPPYPYNAEIRADIEREEDLGTVERFLMLCTQITNLNRFIEEDKEFYEAQGTPNEMLGVWDKEKDEITDEIFSITAVFDAEDISNDGSWQQNTLKDILSEWDWVYRDDLSFSDDELLQIFYPDKYDVDSSIVETLSQQEYERACAYEDQWSL